ncbi:MAG: entericidin, EcnA/B family [Amphiplicatus sp.]
MRLFVILAFGLILTACATVQGVGRDVTSIGKAMEDAVD